MSTTTVTTLKNADWDRLEKNVTRKIGLLRATVAALPEDETGNKIARDIYLPLVRLLANFCASIDEEVPQDDGPAAEAAGCSP
ncbi:MAG: hypothetical protein IT442_04870 [Phycisphaeraceae bacterium]|nr:hypothetical protein [Phycisphaeraceae bacterium]